MDAVFGVSTHEKVVGTVRFHCPAENGPRNGTHVEVRRWHTAMGRRMIPDAVLARTVRCQSCRATFPASVLDALAMDAPVTTDPLSVEITLVDDAPGAEVGEVETHRAV